MRRLWAPVGLPTIHAVLALQELPHNKVERRPPPGGEGLRCIKDPLYGHIGCYRSGVRGWPPVHAGGLPSVRLGRAAPLRGRRFVWR